MRKLGGLKLNQFSKDELEQRKLNALRGGCECRNMCGCIEPDDKSDENTTYNAGVKPFYVYSY